MKPARGGTVAEQDPPKHSRGRWSLRTRIILVLIALVVVALGTTDAITYTSLRSYLFQQLDSSTVRTAAGGLSVSGRLLTIQSVKLSPATTSSSVKSAGAGSEQLSGNVTATAYVLPASQGLTAGATTSAPAGTASTPAATPASTSATTSSATAPALVRVAP